MFTAYFDESGTLRDANAFTVAGGVSSVKKWLQFEDRWKTILKAHGVAVFHMTDCAQSRGEFKGWNAEKRKLLLSELGECMTKYVKKGFGVTVMLGDWRMVDSEFQLTEILGSPYVYAGWLCISAVVLWLHQIKERVPIEFVFEDGAEHKGKLLDFVSASLHINPIFKPKELSQLQVADFIAWKNRRILHDLVGIPFTMSEQQFKDSFAKVRSMPNDYKVVEEEKLRIACARFKIPRRVRKR